MGLISMCSLRSLTPLPKPPDSKLSVTTTLTPKELCREAALASGVTQTYELTHQPLAKTKRPEIHFNTRAGPRSDIVPAVDRVVTATHCTRFSHSVSYFTTCYRIRINFKCYSCSVQNRREWIYHSKNRYIKYLNKKVTLKNMYIQTAHDNIIYKHLKVEIFTEREVQRYVLCNTNYHSDDDD